MALPKVKPQGGTPTSSDFMSLQTQWAAVLDPVLSDFRSEHSLVGVVFIWAPVKYIPTKFALCLGQVEPQRLYPELYEAIGDEYNTGGEPAGTFRFPAAGSPLPYIIRYKP